MAMLKLSSPWINYYRAVDAMFKHDSTVHVVMDEEDCNLKLYVDNPYSADKAAALQKLLPAEKEFGGVTLKISVIPSNDTSDTGFQLRCEHDAAPAHELFERAFHGNEAFIRAVEVDGILGWTATYVVFQKEVVQYFTDDIGDLNGVCSTLYQEIAQEIFEEIPGVFYCTNTKESLTGGLLRF